MNNVLSEKLEHLQTLEVSLTEDIRQAHNLVDEDEDVMLNWDEQRDYEYLYDRLDLFAALQGLIENDTIDNATRAQMLDVLVADAQDVIAERTTDIDKARAVIADMQQLLTLCEQAKDTLS